MTETERSGFELVIGNRQLAAVLFVFAAVTASVAAVAYVAGRTVAPVQAAEPAKSQPVIEVKPQPPLATVQAAEPVEAVRHITPQAGEMYVQVGVVERAMAEALSEHLCRKGFAAGVADGTSEMNLRVLVGPVSTATEAASIQAQLETAGFRSFVRRY